MSNITKKKRSVELIVLGLLAALIMVLATPLLSNVTQKRQAGDITARLK